MIESRYWRDALRRDISWLRRKRHYLRWTEKQMVLYERKLMMVAFQIRSLLERPKVARTIATKSFYVIRYDRQGSTPVTKLTMDLERCFDLASPQRTSLLAPHLCNQLIHHYVMFVQSGRVGQFTTLLVASDYKRNECLFEMDVSKIIDFFALFSADKSALANSGDTVRYVWDEKSQDYDLITRAPGKTGSG